MIAESSSVPMPPAPPARASMRPRSYDRGKLGACADSRLGALPHMLEAVRASMRPRSYDRGKGLRSCARDRRRHASMRPRSYDRGKSQVQVQVEDLGFNEAAII